VTDRLLLGSDFPSATVDTVIAGLQAVTTSSPARASDNLRECPAIDHPREWRRAFPEWATDATLAHAKGDP